MSLSTVDDSVSVEPRLQQTAVAFQRAARNRFSINQLQLQISTVFISRDIRSRTSKTMIGECRNKTCLNDGGSPHPTVDDFVLRKPRTSINRNSVQQAACNRFNTNHLQTENLNGVLNGLESGSGTRCSTRHPSWNPFRFNIKKPRGVESC
jgi:predicted nuclease of restriction endonuclease-like (RecB) superfamily